MAAPKAFTVVAVVLIKLKVVSGVVKSASTLTLLLLLSNTKSPVVVDIVLSVTTPTVILPNVLPPPPGSAQLKLPLPSLVSTSLAAPATPGNT